MPVNSVYPHYVAKVERKGHSQAELDQVICWLTGHTQKSFEAEVEKGTDFEAFFATAPALNPNRKLITGTICGIRVEELEPGTMQEIRYLDKLVDELAGGKAMEKILRSS